MLNHSFADESPPLVPQTLADAEMLNSVLTGAVVGDIIQSTPNSSFDDLSNASAPESPPIESIDEPALPAAGGDTAATIRLKFVDDTSRIVRAALDYTVAEFKR